MSDKWLPLTPARLFRRPREEASGRTRISAEFLKNIESDHRKRGDDRNSAFPTPPWLDFFGAPRAEACWRDRPQARADAAPPAGPLALTCGCVDVWMYGRMDVWMYGCVDVWMYGCMDVWMYGCMDVWIYGCMVVWMYGRMDVWMSGCLDVWMYGCMDVWMYGCVWMCMDVYGCVWMCMGMYGCVWMYGCMDVWMYGCMDVWMYEYIPLPPQGKPERLACRLEFWLAAGHVTCRSRRALLLLLQLLLLLL